MLLAVDQAAAELATAQEATAKDQETITQLQAQLQNAGQSNSGTCQAVFMSIPLVVSGLPLHCQHQSERSRVKSAECQQNGEVNRVQTSNLGAVLKTRFRVQVS